METVNEFNHSTVTSLSYLALGIMYFSTAAVLHFNVMKWFGFFNVGMSFIVCPFLLNFILPAESSVSSNALVQKFKCTKKPLLSRGLPSNFIEAVKDVLNVLINLRRVNRIWAINALDLATSASEVCDEARKKV